MRRVATATMALALVGVVGGTSLAASVHFKGGKGAGPSFTDNGLTLSSTGALTGLGNANVRITLTATGNPTSTCTNPSGANQPPGQNPASVTLTGVQSIPASAIKNGNVTFGVQTGAPASPVPGAPDCPNRNWTERITDVAFTSATLTVEQPVGTVVLRATCTFKTPTVNGAVPSSNVTCTTTS